MSEAGSEKNGETEGDGPGEMLTNVAAQDDTTTMLADASILPTGVNTVSVDTNTTFEMKGSNLDSIMQEAEVMELDLLDNTSGQPIHPQQETQVVGTFDNIQELQKAFEMLAKKPKPKAIKGHVMGIKRLPDELLPAKNKNAKLDEEPVKLEKLEDRNQELSKEEGLEENGELEGDEPEEPQRNTDAQDEVAVDNDLEKIYELAKAAMGEIKGAGPEEM